MGLSTSNVLIPVALVAWCALMGVYFACHNPVWRVVARVAAVEDRVYAELYAARDETFLESLSLAIRIIYGYTLSITRILASGAARIADFPLGQCRLNG